jgi:phosphohistidine phosphatase
VQLLLIRHAHALDGDDDAARPLSPRGRKQVRALARALHRAGVFAAGEIWHSPLVRARDTAALLAQRLGTRAKLVEMDGLAPGNDPAVVAALLKFHRQPLAIVGHEPHLSALASLLVAGAAAPAVFALRKCAALALERDNDRWTVRWLVSPDLLQ